jgi:hypothetical protein
MPEACNHVLLTLHFASSYDSLSLSIQISLSSGPEGTKGVRGDVWRLMYAFHGLGPEDAEMTRFPLPLRSSHTRLMSDAHSSFTHSYQMSY